MKSKLIRKKDLKPILIYFVGLFGSTSFAVILFAALGLKEDYANLYQIICEGIIFLLFIIMYKRYIKFDIKRLTKKEWIFILIAGVVIIGGNDLLSRLFEYFNVPMNNQDTVIGLFKSYPVPSFLFIVLFGPVVEEIVFRYSISTLMENDSWFLIISSLAFGMIHGIGIITILYVLIGLGLGIVYLKTNRNIVSSTIIHILNNLVSVLMMILSI